eukprot:2245583-Alexandrium_andersonii.AAC.1
MRVRKRSAPTPAQTATNHESRAAAQGKVLTRVRRACAATCSFSGSARRPRPSTAGIKLTTDNLAERTSGKSDSSDTNWAPRACG